MKKRLFFLLFFLCLIFPFNVYADSSSSSVAIDINSKRILYENNKDEKRLIASITKVMTALIALEYGNLGDVVTAGEEILSMYGSNIYLELGEEMTLENLLYGLMLRSGNDAAVVIANHISKSEKEFVILMNEKAKDLGMKNTIFSNAHGLDEETKNYSSAYDMAILTSYVHKKYPKFRKISKTKKHEVITENKSYLWYNRNRLLDTYEYVTGGKTGYTPSAGRTLVSTAKHEDLELVLVSLNDDEMFSNHKRIYEEIFSKYKNYKIIRKEKLILDPNIFKGTILIKDDFSYPLTKEETKMVTTLMKIDEKGKYKENGKIGYIKISLNDELLKRVPIYSDEKKETRGFFQWLKNIFTLNLV